MGIFDDAVPGGNITKPIMIALGALLVGKLMSGRSAPDETAPQQQANPQGNDGGLLGGLGGILGGAAGGGLAGGLGGGLGGLLGKLAEAGQGSAVDSWVKPGPNQPIEPGHLENAIGSQTISDLAKQAGISEQELLQQLSRVLPGVVDKLTPQGQIPDQTRIAALLQS
jgi:uncharacterized protein YidB (DUF937 family)